MLYFEFFKLDWLFIDTVIIILLLSILLIVKIFKFKTRWRFYYSNTSLSRIKIINTYSNGKRSLFSIKKLNILRNMNLKDSERPKIGIISYTLKNQSRLNRIITRGLSSYGFDVINLKVMISSAYKDLKDEEYENQMRNLISSLNIILQKNNMYFDFYLIIFDSESKLYFSRVLLQQENNLALLINPKIDKNFKKTIITFFPDDNTSQKFLIIFSKKKLLIFKNKSLLKFQKVIPDYIKRNLNIKIFEKSQNSFKYYETLLLGMIIDFLEPFI